MQFFLNSCGQVRGAEFDGDDAKLVAKFIEVIFPTIVVGNEVTFSGGQVCSHVGLSFQSHHLPLVVVWQGVVTRLVLSRSFVSGSVLRETPHGAGAK